MAKWRGLWFFGVICGILHACMAQAATTLRLSAIADSSMMSESEAIADGAGPHIWVGQTVGGVYRRAMLRFDLSAIEPGSVVLGARLTVFMSKTIHPGRMIAVHRLVSSWGEGSSSGGSGGAGSTAGFLDSTWGWRFYGPRIPWATRGGDYLSAPSASRRVEVAGAPYEWSSPQMIADVQGWIDRPISNAGWIMIGDEASPSAMRFDSRSAGGNPPLLELDILPPAPAVPSPFQTPELTVHLGGGDGAQHLLGALAVSLLRSDVDPVLGRFAVHTFLDDGQTPGVFDDDGNQFRAYYGVMRSDADITPDLRGRRVLLVHRVRGGSLSGVTAVARGQALQTLPVTTATCTAQPIAGSRRCAVAGVDPGEGAATGAEVIPDFGASDVPLAAYKAPLNIAAGQTQLTPGEQQRLAVRDSVTVMHAVVATSNVPASTFFSRALYGAILTGQIPDWRGVDPAITSGHTQMVICRGHPGSGVQASYNHHFNHFPCQFGSLGGTGTQVPARMTDSSTFVVNGGVWPIADASSPGTGGTRGNPRLIDPADGFTVIENPTQGGVRMCLARAVSGGDYDFVSSDGVAYRVRFGARTGSDTGYRAVGVLSLDSLGTALPPLPGVDSSEEAGRWSFRALDGASVYRTTAFDPAAAAFAAIGGGVMPSLAELRSGAWALSSDLVFLYRVQPAGVALPLAADALKLAYVDAFIRRMSDPGALASLPSVARFAAAVRPDVAGPLDSAARASRMGNLCAPLTFFR